MRAGNLRRRITLQSLAVTQGSTGAVTGTTPTDEATVWAEVLPRDGRQFLAAQGQHAEVTHVIQIRYRPNVTRKMQVKLGTRVLAIESVTDLEERHRTLQLICVERV